MPSVKEMLFLLTKSILKEYDQQFPTENLVSTQVIFIIIIFIHNANSDVLFWHHC